MVHGASSLISSVILSITIASKQGLNADPWCSDFTDLSTQSRDRLVVGILDERLSKEMQIMDEETLTEQNAVSMIRQRVCLVWKEIRTRKK